MNRRFTLTAVCRTLVTGSLLVLFHTANAQPQNPTGIPQGIPPIDFNRVSVQGSVTDDSGYAIPGAIVRFRNEVTGGITKKHTDEDGEYGATLSPGTYVVT